MKHLIQFISLMTLLSGHVVGNEASHNMCNEDGRCINPDTNTVLDLGISFKPVYRSLYDITLLQTKASCEAKDLTSQQSVLLPKKSFFRQTFDNEAQTHNEIIVHVFDIDKHALDQVNKANTNEKTTIDTYFNSPFKVCLNGKHRVAKSNYMRVGGFNTGLLVVPFKLRDGDIYSDSTIGPYISYKWQVTEILATAGLSQISVSEIGTETIKTETGITAAVGINFEIDTNWDIAFLLGIDHLSGEKGDNWEYQDEVWISFGIGFNFTR